MEAGPEITVSNTKELAVEATHATDFVWAVRLAKVTKNGLLPNWSMETIFGRESFLGPKAVFNADGDEINVEAVVATEGLKECRVVEDTGLVSAFVLSTPGPSD